MQEITRFPFPLQGDGALQAELRVAQPAIRRGRRTDSARGSSSPTGLFSGTRLRRVATCCRDTTCCRQTTARRNTHLLNRLRVTFFPADSPVMPWHHIAPSGGPEQLLKLSVRSCLRKCRTSGRLAFRWNCISSHFLYSAQTSAFSLLYMFHQPDTRDRNNLNGYPLLREDALLCGKSCDSGRR